MPIMYQRVFVCQVSQQEVHRVWCAVREQLYSQDMALMHGRVTLVTSIVDRLLALHNREPFLSEQQQQHFRAGARSQITPSDSGIKLE